VGIFRIQSQTFGGQAKYFLPEIMIILMVMINIYKETLTGLFEKNENQVESIEMAT